jgi:acid stress-induced BolA-like protein IbaG/YrbA
MYLFMTPEQIQELIEANLADCTAKVASDDNTHFDAVVVSPAFAGKRPLQRHQMVYATLGEKMGGEIHALSIRALTPDESSTPDG